jgi:hypothetical protein
MRKKRSDAYEKHFSRACCNSAGSLGCTIARHSNGGIDRTVEAIDGAIGVYRLVLEGEPEAWLLGRPAQPVFRGCETPAPRATKRPPIVPADLSEADSDICRPRGSRTPGLEARSSAGSALPRLEVQPRLRSAHKNVQRTVWRLETGQDRKRPSLRSSPRSRRISE